LLAAKILKGSSVKVGCVAGFPAGNSSIAVKAFETEQACKDGAVEIDMVINIGKALQEDWNYIETEIRTVVETARRFGAITKVIFETDYVSSDKHKIKLCEISALTGAAYVKTSTGYGFVRQTDGSYAYTGATAHDIKLMRKYCPSGMKIKAAGGIRTLDQLLHFKELGIDRCGASATQSILEEAKIRFGV
jgi:deoxyribose-phosphate aldolase